MARNSPARTTSRIAWRTAIVDAIGLAILLRIGLGILAAYIAIKGDAPGPCHFELAQDGWVTIPRLESQGFDFGLLGVWQRWDACWYGKIATFGYDPGANSAVFFPLFPLLIRLVSPLTGGSVALAGYLVTLVASIVALAGIVRLVGGDLGRRVGRRTALYLSIFPSAFFMIAPFTEATFLACAVVAILAARERRWGLAIFAGFFAGLARLQGAFLVLPIGWEALRATREWWSARNQQEIPTSPERAAPESGATPAIEGETPVIEGETPAEPAASRPGFEMIPRLAPFAAALAPVLGLAVYLGYALVVIGLTPFDAQDAWGGREFHTPWDVATAAINWGIDHRDPLQFVNLGVLAGFGLISLVSIRRLPFAYTLYALPQLALLAIRLQPTPLTATTRYVLVVFPVFAALALAGRHPWIDRTIVVLSALGLGLLATEFVRGNWVA